MLWYFSQRKSPGDMTLTAHWVPAQITVNSTMMVLDADGSDMEIQTEFDLRREELRRTPLVKRRYLRRLRNYTSGQIITTQTPLSQISQRYVLLAAAWSAEVCRPCRQNRNSDLGACSQVAVFVDFAC